MLRIKKELKITKYSILEMTIILLALLSISSGIVYYWFNLSISYADDILTILAILFAIFILLFFHKESKVPISLFLVPTIMTGIGFVGNIVNNYQKNYFAIIMDAFSWQKFFLLYACFVVIFQKKKKRVFLYLRTAQNISRFLVIYGLVTAVLNLAGIIQLAPGHERYGCSAFSFGLHPSSTASILAAVVGLLYWNEEDNIWYIYFSLILLVLTFRFKGIAFVCLVVYFIVRNKSHNKIRSKIRVPLILQMVPIVICIFFVCWEQITFYFLRPTASRARALMTSFKIAAKSFPVGGGFASFGTLMSGIYYSDAYRQFVLSDIWGFTRENHGFIGDGGFATIIGQLGWSGLLVVVLNIVLICKFVKKCSKKKEVPISCLLLLAYLLISQSNEGAFYAENAPVFALILALLTISYNQAKEAI